MSPRHALDAAINAVAAIEDNLSTSYSDAILSALAAEGWVLVRAAEPAPKMMLNGKMNPDYLSWNEQHRLTCGTCGERLRDHIEGVSGHAFVRTLARLRAALSEGTADINNQWTKMESPINSIDGGHDDR